MVAKRLVGPYGQWTSPADGERPSKSVASRHESRAGNARDRKGRRGRKGRMGDEKKRKQRKRLTRCIPLSHCNNNCNSTSNNHDNGGNHDRGSSGRNGRSSRSHATSVATTGVFKLKELATKGELLFPSSKGVLIWCSRTGCHPH